MFSYELNPSDAVSALTNPKGIITSACPIKAPLIACAMIILYVYSVETSRVSTINSLY